MGVGTIKPAFKISARLSSNLFPMFKQIVREENLAFSEINECVPLELFGKVILASVYASYEAVKYYVVDFGQKISNRLGDIHSSNEQA